MQLHFFPYPSPPSLSWTLFSFLCQGAVSPTPDGKWLSFLFFTGDYLEIFSRLHCTTQRMSGVYCMLYSAVLSHFTLRVDYIKGFLLFNSYWMNSYYFSKHIEGVTHTFWIWIIVILPWLLYLKEKSDVSITQPPFTILLWVDISFCRNWGFAKIFY